MRKKWIYKELTKQIFKTMGWMAILFQIILLLLVVKPIIEAIIGAFQYPEFEVYTKSLFEREIEIQIIIFIIVPMILGMFLFNFLMRRSSSDFIHGLPIPRKVVYFHHVISGVVLLIVPIITTAFISWFLVHAQIFPPEAVADLRCMEWILFASGIALISFSLSTIGAMVSGNFIVQGIISLGIFMTPFIFPQSFEDIMSRFLYGFRLDTLDTTTLGEPALSVAWIILASVVLWLMSKVYRKRKVENISEPIIFNAFKPVFKLLFTLLAMFTTALVTLNFPIGNVVFVITLLMGSLVGYIFALIVLKELKVSWENYRTFVVHCAVLIVGLVGVHFYAPTFNNAIPDSAEVSEVIIGDVGAKMDPDFGEALLEGRTLSEPESIETITALHQQFVAQKPSSENEAEYGGYFEITYKLENGREISRTYTYSDEEAYKALYDAATSLPEFRENICEFLDTTVREELGQISMDFSNGSLEIYSSDSEMYNSLIDALIEDVKVVSDLGAEDGQGMGCQIAFLSKGGEGLNYYITSEYTNTIQWLEDNGFEEEAAALAKGEAVY